MEEPEDLFRPTAAVTADGTPWHLFGRRVGGPDGVGRVGVWASRFVDGAWSSPEPVSTTDGPSFNQEVVAHADGSLRVCWQGRIDSRFGVVARRFAAGAWEAPVLVTAGVTGNVWDPTLAATPHGTAYAWAEYAGGSYRVALREIKDDGEPGPVRVLTGGTDYALHPSLRHHDRRPAVVRLRRDHRGRPTAAAARRGCGPDPSPGPPPTSPTDAPGRRACPRSCCPR